MRTKKDFRSKNSLSRQVIDQAIYRERRNSAGRPKWSAQFSGWTHATRPRGQSIALRRVVPPA